ncbi:TrkH family potassium uptake protein [Oceanibacterium hippocampi]|uniref:Trk system potassium uptake protein TrkH n=1 Tax=Oceanibacterium hippocampi TaxID=745714 RepID=A0A1Y5T3Q2_9PROT|nr:potassium transporter TrkG [Oceanibacterium hippocampi]SLN54691.1 Trk system potassium uptake protein TrkH [Oceanibacterium hippocampi]
MSFRSTLAVLGWILALFAVAIALPVPIALAEGNGVLATTFLASGMLTLFIGVAMIMATRDQEIELLRREGFLIVALAWTVLPIFGALPFYFGIGLDPTDAYFEALSGLTTNGATIVPSVEALPKSLIFWRALMQGIGGFGTAVFAIVFAAMLGLGEQSGRLPHLSRNRHDGVGRRIGNAAESLGITFATLIGICALMLWLVGIPAFDAVAHAFSAVSTGGFSSRDLSVSAFDNPRAEAVLIVFMLAGGMNVLLHWGLMRGRIGPYFRDRELRLYLLVAGLGAGVAAAAIATSGLYSVPEGLRFGIFAAVSALTTTGFVAEDPDLIVGHWPEVVPVTLFILMVIGGTTGSSAGGIRIARFNLLILQASKELARLSFPHSVRRLSVAGTLVDEGVTQAAWGYFFFYVVSLAAVGLFLTANGLDFRLAMASAASSLSSAGPLKATLAGASGHGILHYADYPDTAKWALAFAMLIGRLEFFALLSLLNPAFWRR